MRAYSPPERGVLLSYYSPLYFLAVGVMLAGVTPAIFAQRIEDKRDIKTLSEVKAFLDGADPEDIPHTRKLPGAVCVALQMAIGAVAGLVLMAAFMLTARYAAGKHQPR